MSHISTYKIVFQRMLLIRSGAEEAQELPSLPPSLYSAPAQIRSIRCVVQQAQTAYSVFGPLVV